SQGEKKQQKELAPEPKQEKETTTAKDQPEPGSYRDVALDVRDQAVSRGEKPPSAKKKYPQVPRGRLKLSIYLPFASEAGKYRVRIYKHSAKPLLDTTGTATVRKSITILEIKVDTSHLSTGEYVLETRHNGSTSGYQYTFLVAEK